MVFRRRPKTSAAPANPTSSPDLRVRVSSRLLANALAGVLERHEQLTILDLGPGSAGTVDFFAELDCPTRITFADCHSLATDLAHAANAESPPSFASKVLLAAQHMGLDEPIDLVLLWDYLHYFDLESIEVLSSALQPYIHNKTRGYGFGTLHSDQGIKPYNYSIASDTEVFLQPRAEQALPFSPSQQALTDNFICLRISRGTLLQEGHLELLLEA